MLCVDSAISYLSSLVVSEGINNLMNTVYVSNSIHGCIQQYLWFYILLLIHFNGILEGYRSSLM